MQFKETVYDHLIKWMITFAEKQLYNYRIVLNQHTEIKKKKISFS